MQLEAGVRLLVSDSGTDDDVGTGTSQDGRQELHQTTDDVGVINHI